MEKETDELAFYYRITTSPQEKLLIKEEILKMWSSYFWKCVYSSGIPEEEQEDVFQDISLDCLLVLDKRWKGYGSFSAVLKSNIVNTLKNFWLKKSAQKRSKPVSSFDENPLLLDSSASRPFEGRFESEKLEIVYNLATEREKFIIDHILSGWTYKEISQELGLVSCTIHAILKSLGKRVKKAIRNFKIDTVEEEMHESN